MAWYEGVTCFVCGKTIERLRFWQAKPHLVDVKGNETKVAKKSDDEVQPLLATHKVACDNCFSERYDRLLEIVARSGSSDTKT